MNILKTDPGTGHKEEISFAQACREIDAVKTTDNTPAKLYLLKTGKHVANKHLYEVPKWMRVHGSMEPGEVDAMARYLSTMARRANQKDCGTIGAILEEVISAIRYGWTSQLLDAITAIYEPGNGLLDEPIEEKDGPQIGLKYLVKETRSLIEEKTITLEPTEKQKLIDAACKAEEQFDLDDLERFADTQRK